ncbi:MAG: hypothetical protein JSS53_07900 [Proteobacteria bacterium]|nr:hypothetical protein [Pseudomonadota bacterium]
MSTKVMISLPDALATRMRAVIPNRQRSKLFATLLEEEINKREKELYMRALDLENNKGSAQEESDWETNFGGDGLNDI